MGNEGERYVLNRVGFSEFWQGVVVHWGMVLWRFSQACLHQAEEGGQIPRAL